MYCVSIPNIIIFILKSIQTVLKQYISIQIIINIVADIFK